MPRAKARAPGPAPAVPAPPRREEPARAAGEPASTLLVVESPAKGKTLKRWLGPAFQVRASAGHVKDLPSSRLGVDVEHGFAPTYDVILGRAKVLSDIKRAARRADLVLLATDPDREGEAIAWHLAEELGAAGGKGPKIRRVLLDELTEGAIQRALQAPRDLDRNRFEAQQARRILDRLVGFQMSPVLWRTVRKGLSAGRVQSVVVRLVVDRERAIEAFVPRASWVLEAELRAGGRRGFRAVLAGPGAGPADGESARALAAELAGRPFTVAAVERRERLRHPPPPFSTATLQQEAWRRLGFAPRKTMRLAQRLYEGVEVAEEGAVGLVTYVRTDAVRLSDGAVAAARAHIARTFGAGHLPRAPAIHPAGRRAGREAHEAVRPTSLAWTPERLEPLLEAEGGQDLLRLYRLVWSRFLASQMAPAVYGETLVEVAAGPARFRARGRVLLQAGYLAAHGDEPPGDEAGAAPEAGAAAGDGEAGAGWEELRLPALEVGQALRVAEVVAERRESRPPPRFDEASLVGELEERGIGRPSTYAAILSTIQEKAYVVKAGRSLAPTALGLRVTDALVGAFPRQLDAAYTAAVEARLDEVEAGRAAWQAVLADFHAAFAQDLARAEGGASPPGRAAGAAAPAGAIACARCGKVMVVRFGRMGEFLSCPGYPACRHTVNFRRGEDGAILPLTEAEVAGGEACDACGKPMVVKRGRFGRFLACSGYPACKRARPVPVGVACPKACGGYVGERRSRSGKAFYGCSGYPACDFVSWDRPREEDCPTCGSAWLVEKVSRKAGPVVACPNAECGYERPAEGGGGPPAPGGLEA